MSTWFLVKKQKTTPAKCTNVGWISLVPSPTDSWSLMSYDLTALSVLWRHRHPWVKAQVWENETERQAWHLRMGRFGVGWVSWRYFLLLGFWVNYCSSLRWFIQFLFVYIWRLTFWDELWTFKTQSVFVCAFGDSLLALDSIQTLLPFQLA